MPRHEPCQSNNSISAVRYRYELQVHPSETIGSRGFVDVFREYALKRHLGVSVKIKNQISSVRCLDTHPLQFLIKLLHLVQKYEHFPWFR